MEVKINREIRNYTESMFFGLSMRQFIFSVLACGVAVGLYFILRPYFGVETLSWMCILGAAPFAMLGFITYHGMTAEQFIWAWLRSEMLEPKELKFEDSNNNPVTDRAEVFWKTIYNWCNYFTQGQYPPKVVLKYIVVSSHSIKAGTIPKLFAEAKTETEATEALESARIILFGDTQSKENPRPISQTIETP